MAKRTAPSINSPTNTFQRFMLDVVLFVPKGANIGLINAFIKKCVRGS